MKRIVCWLAICMLLLCSCGGSFRAEFSDGDSSVQMRVRLGGPQYADLCFTINATDYSVASAPTVSDPTFTLQAEASLPVLLIMPEGTEGEAVLQITQADGSIRTYTAPASEIQPLLDWARTN